MEEKTEEKGGLITGVVIISKLHRNKEGKISEEKSGIETGCVILIVTQKY